MKTSLHIGLASLLLAVGTSTGAVAQKPIKVGYPVILSGPAR